MIDYGIGEAILTIIGAVFVFVGLLKRHFFPPHRITSTDKGNDREVVDNPVPEPVPVPKPVPVPDDAVPVSRHLSPEQIIVFLAAQKAESGAWRFSGNKIGALMEGQNAGQRKDIQAIIRDVRGEKVEYVGEQIARIKKEVADATNNPSKAD